MVRLHHGKNFSKLVCFEEQNKLQQVYFCHCVNAASVSAGVLNFKKIRMSRAKFDK
jgi:hypothetical protein